MRQPARPEQRTDSPGDETSFWEGYHQGLAQGMLAGKRDTLRQLLERRFDHLSPHLTTYLEELHNPDEIDRLIRQVARWPDPGGGGVGIAPP